MYIIKQIPEDFVVKEITSIDPKEKGSYSYFLLKKTNYTTIKAIQTIARRLGIQIKQIGFAGTKDKKAVTEQYISIRNKSKIKDLNLSDIELNHVGYGDEPISLGDLKANEFIITIRNLNDISKIPNKLKILNLFDEQRFSLNNIGIGKSIIKKDFKKAVELILENENVFKGEYESRVRDYLKKKPNDYIGAMRTIPKKILLLFVHSFQSSMWNTIALEISKNKNICSKIDILPIIGFGTEFNNKDIKEVSENEMEKQKITQRDFIIRQFPELTSEGNERPLFVNIVNLKEIEQSDDELNPGKKKIKISFALPKASYATLVIKELFSP